VAGRATSPAFAPIGWREYGGAIRPFALALAAAGILLIGVTPGSATASAPCFPKSSRTLLKTKHVRIFFDRKRDRWYGCLLATGKRTTLATLKGEIGDGGAFYKDDVRVAGDFVGYATDYCGADGFCASSVRVRNLAKGTKVTDVLATPNDLSEAGADVSDLEVTKRGSVAWIAALDGGPQEVWAAEAGKKQKQLDGGLIEKKSLKLAGSELSWLKDGLRQTATLR
jgi:hypothetical protein